MICDCIATQGSAASDLSAIFAQACLSQYEYLGLNITVTPTLIDFEYLSPVVYLAGDFILITMKKMLVIFFFYLKVCSSHKQKQNKTFSQ